MSFKFGAAKVFAFFILFFVIYIPLSAQSPPAADSIYRLPAGTHIRLRMQGDIGSKFSSVDDTFLTRVALPVVVRDVTVLPMGVVMGAFSPILFRCGATPRCRSWSTTRNSNFQVVQSSGGCRRRGGRGQADAPTQNRGSPA